MNDTGIPRKINRDATDTPSAGHIDVTTAARDKIVEALLVSEARLSDILNIVHEAIISVDDNQTIILFNSGAEAIFGYSAAEVIGKPLDVLLPPQLAAKHRAHIADFGTEAERSRLMGNRQTIMGRRKDGSIFPAEASISKLERPHRLYTVVLRDITNRRRAQREREYLIEQLRALDDASRAITAELSLNQVLQTIANTAQSLMKVKIAALGVHDEDEYFSRFITAGIEPEIAEMFEASAYGRKLLGPLFYKGMPVIINEIPPVIGGTVAPIDTPPMESLLGVPIAAKGKLIGALYLADKLDGEPFTETDRRILERLAVHAAIAIKNAEAYEQTQRLAILEERERFAQDLHDGIIQSIYAVGLMLDQAKADIPPEHETARQQIDLTLNSLAGVIEDIRAYIFDLRPQAIKDDGLTNRLMGLIREVRANTHIPIEAEIDPDVCEHISSEQATHLFHICHEALSNAVRHAHPSHITIQLKRKDNVVVLKVSDDGVGFVMPSTVKPGHRGLANMRSRAFQTGARMEIQSIPNKGTQVIVTVKGRHQ